MDKQREHHFQKDQAKPTQFQHTRYINSSHTYATSLLSSQTTAHSAIQLRLTIRVCLCLHFALYESIDRVRLIRTFSFQLRSHGPKVRTSPISVSDRDTTEFFISYPPPGKGNAPVPAQPGPSNGNSPHPAQQGASNLPKLAPKVPANPPSEYVTVLILDLCQMIDNFVPGDPTDPQRTSSSTIPLPMITASVRSASDPPTFAFRPQAGRHSLI